MLPQVLARRLVDRGVDDGAGEAERTAEQRPASDPGGGEISSPVIAR